MINQWTIHHQFVCVCVCVSTGARQTDVLSSVCQLFAQLAPRVGPFFLHLHLLLSTPVANRQQEQQQPESLKWMTLQTSFFSFSSRRCPKRTRQSWRTRRPSPIQTSKRENNNKRRRRRRRRSRLFVCLFVCIRCWRLWRKERKRRRRRKKSFASAGIGEEAYTIAWWLPQWLPVLPDIVKSTPWWANTESPLVRSRNINVSGVRPSVVAPCVSGRILLLCSRGESGRHIITGDNVKIFLGSPSFFLLTFVPFWFF